MTEKKITSIGQIWTTGLGVEWIAVRFIPGYKIDGKYEVEPYWRMVRADDPLSKGILWDNKQTSIDLVTINL